MNGVKIGDNAKGVHELKIHLMNLGYLNFNSYSNNQTNENENAYDYSLELALKKYQSFYDLNVTGVLDTNTILKMQEPRCGIPDFYNTNTNTNESTTFDVVVSHYSFLRGRSRWRKRSLKYAFNINVKEEAKPPLERALKEWADATPFKFFHVKKSKKAHIRMSFLHGDHGDGLPFGTIKGGLAHAFGPNDGRIHFDADEKWASNGDKNAYDIQFVGLHELGHILGLGHSRNEKAVMYPIVDLGERKHLHEDDINGVKALYRFSS